MQVQKLSSTAELLKQLQAGGDTQKKKKEKSHSCCFFMTIERCVQLYHLSAGKRNTTVPSKFWSSSLQKCPSAVAI